MKMLPLCYIGSFYGKLVDNLYEYSEEMWTILI